MFAYIFVIYILDGSCRGPKVIDLKTVADNALAECREKGLDIKISIVVKNVTKDTDEKVDGRSPTTKRQKLLNVGIGFVGKYLLLMFTLQNILLTVSCFF